MKNAFSKVIDGVWNFGFSKTEAVPQTDMLTIVPSCADTYCEFKDQKGYAAYRKQVKISGKVRLSITAGIHSAVYWDGKLIGRSQLGWTREHYDFDAGRGVMHDLLIVTDNIPDENPGSTFRRHYDFYDFNGIYENVEITPLSDGMVEYLEVIPQSHTDGKVKVSIRFYGKAPEKINCSFDGAPPQTLPAASEMILTVPDFKLWSPETPNLHELTVNNMSVRFGIRTLDWQGKRLLLNGREIKLVGFNRHDSHPEFGAATPPSLICNDLLMIKRHGYNFIRGCHYAQKELVLDLADELGLLIWEEPLGWGNSAAEIAAELFIERQVEQLRKMIAKSINHPSVICWGFLNECASDSEAARVIIKRLYDTAKSLDTSRPVTFASNRWKKDICFDLTDIISLNVYPDWYDDNPDTGVSDAIKNLFNEIAENFPEKPIIISEIGCAALSGDHSGYRWSEEFQADYDVTVVANILKMDRFSGVALWQFCDCKTYNTTGFILSRPRGFNNKGVVDEYRRPKMAWKELAKLLKK